MQTQLKAFVQAKPCNIKSRTSTVRVYAQNERKSLVTESAKLLSAGLLSAALFMGTPAAEAKVILVQPDNKNFVTGATPAKSSNSSSSKKAPAAKKPPAAAMTSEGGDAKGLVLPLTLVGLAGAAFAWNAADPGLTKMMVDKGAAARNSNAYAGTEAILKDTPFFGGSGSIPTSTPDGSTGYYGKGKGGGAKPAAKAAKKKLF